MNNIYLVGFMGTGKTTVGKELAKKKKWQFVDLDDLIEFREKRTIADIFARNGEPYFRRIEKRVLKDVTRERNFIVACGGGIVIDPENMKIMKETGLVICLQATTEVIVARTCGQAHRPLLNVENPAERIELLLKMRAPYYAQADLCIDTSKLPMEKVVESIAKVVAPQCQKAPSKKAILRKSSGRNKGSSPKAVFVSKVKTGPRIKAKKDTKVKKR